MNDTNNQQPDYTAILNSIAAAIQNNAALPYTDWTPAVAAAAGALTTASGSGRYRIFGRTVEFYAFLTITNNGTGSGSITMSLPVTALATAANTNIGAGREGALSGKALTVTIGAGGLVNIRNYDNTYPAAAGSVLYISGSYEF